MSSPLYVPRINNNDDYVKVVRLVAAVGDLVRRGDVVAEIESDKSVASVEAEQDGYVLKILCAVDDQVAVGGVMIWLGASADEVVNDAGDEGASTGRRGTIEPTAKARALLTKYGLSPEDVMASSERLSAADVEAHVAQTASILSSRTDIKSASLSLPAGERRPLSVSERGMLHTVSWHRDQAAAAYLEIEFDPKPWNDYADAFAKQHKLMLSPMLPLMAYRLVGLVGGTAKINATLVDGELYQDPEINLGFTVQAGETLYLVVARNAGSMDATSFVSTLGELQRHAIGKKLRPEESQGTTLGFSSMARWNIGRHIPILAPYTSLMVAHAAARQTGVAVLGASYDHRVLSGFDVSQVLNKLSTVPEDSPA